MAGRSTIRKDKFLNEGPIFKKKKPPSLRHSWTALNFP
jgi:hypothetical protein